MATGKTKERTELCAVEKIGFKVPSLYFSGEPEIISKLLGSSSMVNYKKGTIVYMKGEHNDFLYYVHRGVVKISVFGDDGSEKILGYHLQNSLFGLDCLIGNCDASVTAVAITDVVLSRLRHEEIKDLIVENPAVGIALSNYYCRVLRLMCFQAENQCFYDVLTRVANF
ncbi:MAG: Crp/Fnr family transcriptional regulator, partial [Desulfofundulus sp.]